MTLLERVTALELDKQSKPAASMNESMAAMQSRIAERADSRPALGRKHLQGEFTPANGKRSKARRTICTWDVETNPFDNVKQELIVPFIWDLYNGESHTTYYNRWEDWRHCMQKFFDTLSAIKEPQVILAHNGGKFDFTFLAPYFDKQKLLVINGRLVSAWMGQHQFRDSYAMLPVPLAKMEKQKFDYELLREETRWDHIEEICGYLRSDTENLHKYVSAWLEEFGAKPLTMASAAMHKLREMYEYRRLDVHRDSELRKYYFGGRVECFKSNEIVAESINVYDVNSMYPFAMASYEHPIGDRFFVKPQFDLYDPELFFVDVEGTSRGALPVRDSEGLSFPHVRGEFHCTAHELRAGVETGSFTISRIVRALYSDEHCNFYDFIDLYYSMRMEAKQRKDDMYVLFWKLVMNSAYGKFAQNPEKFKEQHIVTLNESIADVEHSLESPIVKDSIEAAGFNLEQWEVSIITSKYVVIEKQVGRYERERGYHNVATAASITGAARSLLLRGISSARGLIYCDTDSLMCESLSGVELDEKKLGAWKHEATGTLAYVVGKKTYALFDGDTPIKHASKGVRLAPEQIRAIALRGEECEVLSKAPSFNLAGEQQYIRRRIRNTVKPIERKRPQNGRKEVRRELYR